MASYVKVSLLIVSIGLATRSVGAPVPAWAHPFLYVSLDGENRIATYAIDSTHGTLQKLADVKLPSPGGALTVSPDSRFLFASLRSAGQLASFRIDANRGSLRLISTIPAGADPAFVATDHSGRYLLTAYYVDGKVTVHAIGGDGTLSNEPVQTIQTADKAHAILTDASNRLAYVPHTGPNAIYGFRFDAQRGQLKPLVPERMDTGQNTGPRQLVFHPKLDIVFFDYEQGSAIAAYDVNRSTGVLRLRETISTLPVGYPQDNSNARIDMTRDGRFVYVANRGHDSLAMFAIDGETGRLRALGQAKTEATPRGFAIDPTDRFVYAAGQSSGKMTAFQIDQTTGRLTPVATYSVGERPWWVLAIDTSPADR